MKSIIIAVLFAGSSLIAAEGAKPNDLGSFSDNAKDGAALYKQNCAKCHGEKATESPKSGIPALAGRDATRLALAIRAYRDQDNDIGTYTMHKNSEVMKNQTVRLSDRQISALAKYISSLK